jgi:hypothetical protein
VLVRKSLAEALGFDAGDRTYYAFRDSIIGLEYLRPGRELCDEGLQVDLTGYECRALLDFREIIDDDFGTWGRLCHELRGRPVASLAEEVKQVRYAGVIDAFRAVTEEFGRLLSAGACAAGELEQAGTLLERFYEELNRHTSCTGDVAAVAGRALQELAAARGLKSVEEERVTTAGSEAGDLLIAAWLALHGIGRLARAAEHAPVAAAWFGELGLDRAFAGLVDAAEASDHPLLLKLMLRWQDFFTGAKGARDRGGVTLLFADSAVRSFLGVHSYRESEWFVKERFDLLLELLYDAAEIARRATGTGEEPTVEAAARRTELHTLEALAAGAGYRVDRFLASCSDSAVPNRE